MAITVGSSVISTNGNVTTSTPAPEFNITEIGDPAGRLMPNRVESASGKTCSGAASGWFAQQRVAMV